ncbi:nitrate/nitrite transporter [uncultured Cellulomonas sp.]|uniref:MFS transporter n=1 Tax=uncultured Cellulomonas sp. TaxID=189682 RepID=UPI0026116A36|nr:MFS transporter [uncultured Cellulomonas sp.]
MTSSPIAPSARLPSRRYALAVWGTAVAAYVVAVLHRSSFGVAGLEASERFGTGASTLAAVVVVQLVVYSGLQVPVGVVLDRVGPRRLIAAGALLMAVGQAAIAMATTAEVAIAARVLIGAGDACTFVSVIRLLPSWFSMRRVPLATQLTGILGMLGQLLAAVPLVLALHRLGWTQAFGATAVLGVLAVLAVLVVVRDSPEHGRADVRRFRMPRRSAERAETLPLAELAQLAEPSGPSGPTGPTGATRARPAADGVRSSTTAAPRPPGRLGATLREPGTWLGFWVHFVSAFSLNAMVLLWAFPFLVSAQGRTPVEASALLSVSVVAAIVAGPVVGQVSGRHPERRLAMVAAVAVLIGAAWTGLLVPAEPLPLGALAAFMAVVAVGGPVSLVGLDIARAHNPRERMGTATGVANAGGFLAALLTMLGVGLVLDARGGGAAGVDLPLADYRVALLSAGVVWVVGMVGLVVSARVVRTRDDAGAPRSSRNTPDTGRSIAGNPAVL